MTTDLETKRRRSREAMTRLRRHRGIRPRDPTPADPQKPPAELRHTDMKAYQRLYQRWWIKNGPVRPPNPDEWMK